MNALAKQAQRHYQRTQVESANPAKLILMLYDGAIRYLYRAVGLLDSGDREGFSTDVVRAQKVVTELMAALDPSKNPEVVGNLERIYDYMVRQLALALVRADPAPAMEVIKLLENLREGWQGAIMQVAQELAGPATDERTQSVPHTRTSYPSTVPPGLMPTLNIAG
jgi:flagellar secretion chaperone FliS